MSVSGGALLVLSCGGSEKPARRLVKLAEMMGVEAILIDACDVIPEEIGAGSIPFGDCLAASSKSLRFLMRRSHQPDRTLQTLLSSFRRVLVYGFDSEVSDDQGLLGKLAESPVHLLRLPAESQEVSFTEQLPATCRQLRGLSFAASSAEANRRGFELSCPGPDLDTLMTVGGCPVLVRIDKDRGQMFLLSSNAIIDIDEPVAPGELCAESYLGLAPWLVFIRSAFGEHCWHNPNPHASWTIDDSLLRPRYGFLCYRDLLGAMDADGFATSIAFIPWNHRRSDSGTVELFRKRPDRLSLCVHGSDHTRGEFQTGDAATLRRKAKTALSRMTNHQSLTGLSFDPIMIFPQGGFCKAALRALSAEGFLAAINTTVFAADWRPEDLTYRDLLDVALDSYGGCPLFSRRYPVDVFPLAFDLFMGKPALIVQHHDYFKHGYAAARRFVRSLNHQDNALVWSSPSQVVTEAALWKHVRTGEQWIRFYTNDFSFRNSTGTSVTYRLHKRLPPGAGVRGLQRDEYPLDFAVHNSMLTAQVQLNPGEVAHIHLSEVEEDDEVCEVRNSPLYQAKVASRRLLSEFRDNYLARNQWLLAKAERLKAFLQEHNLNSDHRY